MKVRNIFIYLLTILILLYYFLDKNIFENFKNIDLKTYIISFFINLFMFFISGLQMSYVIKRITKVQISRLDILMIPVTQNFWGYILPFQGSLIYSVAIFKGKYKINVSKTIYIYLFITVFSLWIGSIVACIHSLTTKDYMNAVFFSQIIISPIYLTLFYQWFGFLKSKNRFLKFLKYHVIQLFRMTKQSLTDKILILKLIICDFVFVLSYAYWTYYISDFFNLNIEFIIWLIWAYFLKITLLAKITPGNIGVVQAYTAGFLALYGHSAEVGVRISLIQLLLLIVLIFPVAIVNSLVNLKYLDFKLFRKT